MVRMCVYLAALQIGIGQQPQQPAQPQTPNQAPPPATATIRGHVTAGDTGQPLRKAQVRLIQTGGFQPGATGTGRENRLATTDADGLYEIKDLPAGRYVLSASKASYVGLQWGQPQVGDGGKPFDVLVGQTIERVDFTLPRGGVITGRIVDEFGEPLSGLQVGAIQSRLVSGQRQMVPSGRMATTDDLGEFRLYGVTPGQYYVQATWRRLGSGDPTSVDQTGYPPTYFPGTVNVGDAQRITVAAGQTISDLAMMLSSIKTARIEGIVVDSGGRPVTGVSLTIGQTMAGGGNMMNGAGVRPDGTFIIASVAPGDYTLRVQPGQGAKEYATMKLTVGSEDIKDLRLVTAPPSTISGRVILDSAQAQSLPNTPLSLISMPRDQMIMGGFQPTRVADDLSFELIATIGRNSINVMNLPPGWSVRAIRINGLDVIDEGIDVKASENVTGVELELTNKVTTISGLVTDGRGEASRDYTAVIFPSDNRRWTPGSRYMRSMRPDQDGRFKVSGLPPGDYLIIAIDRLQQGQSSDPEFLERIRSKATAFMVNEGETKSIDLKVNTGS